MHISKRLQLDQRLTVAILLLFYASWILMLYIDSSALAATGFDGKPIVTGMVIVMYLFLFALAGLRLRILMLIMVPLSWLGEYIFSQWLQLYIYRGFDIPHYVPVGHAVVFASSWILNTTGRLPLLIRRFRKQLVGVYVLMFLFVALYFQDTLSAAISVLFFLALWRKKFSSFYLLMGFVVLYLELVGTWFGCWKWRSDPFIFHTVNPPLGSIFIYVGGDILLNRLFRKGISLWRRIGG